MSIGKKSTDVSELFKKTQLICCICKNPITDDKYGHNPSPVKRKGVCCSMCNSTKVVPARIKEWNE